MQINDDKEGMERGVGARRKQPSTVTQGGSSWSADPAGLSQSSFPAGASGKAGKGGLSAWTHATRVRDPPNSRLVQPWLLQSPLEWTSRRKVLLSLSLLFR